jgi:hypothetical protein
MKLPEQHLATGAASDDKAVAPRPRGHQLTIPLMPSATIATPSQPTSVRSDRNRLAWRLWMKLTARFDGRSGNACSETGSTSIRTVFAGPCRSRDFGVNRTEASPPSRTGAR